MAFLTKDQLRAALTDFHEDIVSSIYLGGDVLIRELTALQRMAANEAAQNEGGEPNNYTYRAMLLQMMIVDPQTGTPYADGRRHPETNEPLIDPRTRTTVFTSDEIYDLMEGREVLVDELLTRGLRLSRLLPSDFRRRGVATDTAEHDAGPSTETDATDTGNDGDAQGVVADQREAHDGDDGADAGPIG